MGRKLAICGFEAWAKNSRCEERKGVDRRKPTRNKEQETAGRDGLGTHFFRRTNRRKKVRNRRASGYLVAETRHETTTGDFKKFLCTFNTPWGTTKTRYFWPRQLRCGPKIVEHRAFRVQLTIPYSWDMGEKTEHTNAHAKKQKDTKERNEQSVVSRRLLVLEISLLEPLRTGSQKIGKHIWWQSLGWKRSGLKLFWRRGIEKTENICQTA